jgi:hypothetical protein
MSSLLPRPPHHRAHTWFWALASIIAMPVALFYFSGAGVSAFTAFLLGLLAVLLVLVLNVLMEGSLWMFDASWHEVFSRPDASLRLVVLAGALLLIVESAAIIFLLISPTSDDAFLVFVRQHRCLVPEPRYQELCQLLTKW